jgi:KDO2-lipid IV(A) lauroyltransferase
LTDLFLIAAIRAFQAFLRVLPERLSRLIGIVLGRLGFLVLSGRRRIAVDNVRRIVPDASDATARAIARTCFEKLGINFVEVLLFPFLRKEEYGQRFRVETRAGVKEALATGKGALALTFHYSNWEITGLASSLLNREVVALARPLKGHRRLDGFLNGMRQATGLTIIPNRDTARDVVRLLKENRIIALLGDQREKRSKAVWVDFFGRSVPTSKGIVMIAMKTGAPVIPAYARREGFLRYTVILERPIPMERRGAPVDELIARNARGINAFLEQIVQADPSEWFLVHRRFGRET